MQSRDSYSRAGHPGMEAAHDWGPPPPGSGRLRVCKKCGAKETENAVGKACDSIQNETFRPTDHDYDPI